MSLFTNITKILKQSLKTQEKKKKAPQLHNKQAFNIFHLVPNFANV